MNENTNITTDNANQSGAVVTDTQNSNVETQTEEGQVTTEKTYSQAEVDMLLQQEADRRVTAALKKQADKFAKEKAEADKLREMDEQQRKEYEFNKKVEELEAKERDFNLMQNKLSASKVMSERGLPVSFVDYIVAEDAETMMANINSFETQWKAAVSDAVSAKLASPAPKVSNASQTGLTKADFAKMTIAQQTEIYKTNPELYKQLTAR